MAFLIARPAIGAAAQDLAATVDRGGPTKHDQLRARIRIVVALHLASVLAFRAGSTRIGRRPHNRRSAA